MISTTRRLPTRSVLALCAAQLVFSTVAHAATINYGNFPFPPASMAMNVTESSATDAVPLYGPPQPVPSGLDFDPMNFASFSNGAVSDFTDGQLNMTIMGPGLQQLKLFEAGDYSLLGTGTSTGTLARAGAILRATITQINGVDIAPIVLNPTNASAAFNIVTNPGITLPWSLQTTLNIASQLAPGQKATKIEVQINNQLFTQAQSTSAAFIAKKEFLLTEVPEPASIAMCALALCGVGLVLNRFGRR